MLLPDNSDRKPAKCPVSDCCEKQPGLRQLRVPGTNETTVGIRAGENLLLL